jgi:hypothetical protein
MHYVHKKESNKKLSLFPKKIAVEDLFESAIPKIVGYPKDLISEVCFCFV